MQQRRTQKQGGFFNIRTLVGVDFSQKFEKRPFQHWVTQTSQNPLEAGACVWVVLVRFAGHELDSVSDV
jgi:hypothetical protein